MLYVQVRKGLGPFERAWLKDVKLLINHGIVTPTGLLADFDASSVSLEWPPIGCILDCLKGGVRGAIIEGTVSVNCPGCWHCVG